MTDITAAAVDLVACAHCGHLDSGTYCSACGKELAPTHRHTLAEAWEMIVVDRVQDLREFLTSTWYLLRRPVRFFRTVMTGPAHRAGHVFPEPVAEPYGHGTVQTPVKYLILGFVAYLIALKITGEPVAEMVRGLGGFAEDLNEEITFLLLMAYLALYGIAFHWSTGRRISVEEAAVFNGYLTGANLLVMAAVLLTPERYSGALLAELGLLVYVGIVLPYKVLPRLYAMSKRRVLVAQVGAFAGAALLVILLALAAAGIASAAGLA